jgi:soluble lytic murein transglycosylase-like protein
MKFTRIIAVAGAIIASAAFSRASWDEPAGVFFARDRGQEVQAYGALPKRISKSTSADRALNQRIVAEAARRHGVPVSLGLAVARQESGFNHRARSHQNAQGLMQVIPSTWRAEGCKGSPWDPAANADCGMRYFAKFYRQGGAHYAALRYHGGSNTRYHGPKTKHYARVVTAAAGMYREPPSWAGTIPTRLAMLR